VSAPSVPHVGGSALDDSNDERVVEECVDPIVGAETLCRTQRFTEALELLRTAGDADQTLRTRVSFWVARARAEEGAGNGYVYYSIPFIFFLKKKKKKKKKRGCSCGPQQHQIL
jgi:hypothetical protein